jgi:hypothetical protein
LALPQLPLFTIQALILFKFVVQMNEGMFEKVSIIHNIPNFLYLSSKPSFFGQIAWPPFGPDKVIV